MGTKPITNLQLVDLYQGVKKFKKLPNVDFDLDWAVSNCEEDITKRTITYEKARIGRAEELCIKIKVLNPGAKENSDNPEDYTEKPAMKPVMIGSMPALDEAGKPILEYDFTPENYAEYEKQVKELGEKVVEVEHYGCHREKIKRDYPALNGMFWRFFVHEIRVVS